MPSSLTNTLARPHREVQMDAQRGHTSNSFRIFSTSQMCPVLNARLPKNLNSRPNTDCASLSLSMALPLSIRFVLDNQILPKAGVHAHPFTFDSLLYTVKGEEPFVSTSLYFVKFAKAPRRTVIVRLRRFCSFSSSSSCLRSGSMHSLQSKVVTRRRRYK